MPQTVRGIIARTKGEPATLETIVIPDPGPGDAIVRIQACGVCHSDLHFRNGGIAGEFPFLLGHEAAGIVEQVGEGVTEVQPGDYVVLNWRAVCSECRNCRRGRPEYCTNTRTASRKMTLEDGTELSTAMGIGAFSDKTLVAAGQCTKVDARIRPQAAGLLGCGVMTGLGAAINTGRVSRGDSVAVIGCGGVGDAAIAGARLAGATTIIGVDTDAKKLDWARDFGATHTVDATKEDVVAAIRTATDGVGADVVIDAVGRAETWEQAFRSRDQGGTVVLVGVPAPGVMAPEIPLVDYFKGDGSLTSSRYGQCLPSRDFPMLVDLHLQGRLPLDAFVSEEIGLDDVEAAFDRMRAGEVVRSVVVL
ncbi:S-(hydroxymethyl)mycothiol dehydrogenase [Schumannella sp. 10F1B-5-1]|uniref:S-(hydroxymethyl)mycothiol dehydrogenase n=1 Tax=Schumannella sp. 10F1B-5-1 TaxID=2590780 RepID=UPI0011329E51|nr:S-(hydroxymethyl)mycothiol dehydrogenase [Schumannella sp. 10F1B-5-1]TPW78245.1 S-(hydroxymethyl)mycothiol dehydrogenase [Schumannella sp. 10F1B-5-1]